MSQGYCVVRKLISDFANDDIYTIVQSYEWSVVFLTIWGIFE